MKLKESQYLKFEKFSLVAVGLSYLVNTKVRGVWVNVKLELRTYLYSIIKPIGRDIDNCLLVPFICLLLFSIQSNGQVDTSKLKNNKQDTAGLKNAIGDSTKLNVDSINLAKKFSKGGIDKEVKYKAKDSIVFDLDTKNVHLYGVTHLDYGTIKLDADSTTINFEKSEIYAQGRRDSTGKMIGEPIFVEGEQIINTKKIAYNFKTKMGVVYDVTTKQGDGQIRGDKTKFVKEDGHDVIYVQNGRYSTCDLPHQHFYIATNKLKLIPGDKIITGPAFLVIEEVRVPLILPFGFFPAQNKKKSGIIIPTFGQSETQGFALREGGYYYGNNQYFDMAVTGDLYTNGTYRLADRIRYTKRYKFNGAVTLSFAENKTGLSETPQYQKSNNYLFTWVHQQDGKARPGSNFSADVNIKSSKYNQFNTYNIATAAEQALSSKITYSKIFPRSPFSLGISAAQNQILSTKRIEITLPQLSFNMQRLTPFKSSKAVKAHWWDQIGVSYNSNFVNELKTYDSLFITDIQNRNFGTAAQHNIPISFNTKLFKYLVITPAFNYSGFLYTQRNNFTFNPTLNKVETSTSKGVYYTQSYNMTVNITSQVFGTARFKRGKIMAIRQVLTPNLGAYYNPDFSEPRYNYYGRYFIDSFNQRIGKETPYSYYNTVNPVSGIGQVNGRKSGGLTFSLAMNSFEAKVKNSKDTANPVKKIKIIESFNVGSSYNFLADSMKLSPFSIQARNTFFEKLTIQSSFTLDPYHYSSYGIVKEYALDKGYLGVLRDATVNAGISLAKKPAAGGRPIMSTVDSRLQFMYPNAYANFDVPANITLNYVLNYTLSPTVINVANNLTEYKKVYNQSATITADANITKNWKLRYNVFYNFQTKQVGNSQFEVFRDLHCWEMSFSWIPSGFQKSYLFNIRVKAQSLQELKYRKQRENFDSR
ncbi:MAG: putative LPS assembly protein LptD [Bacteroidota bacterium]|nr:putative LPS assembly protein LptD [Bacteroidota bacterium]